MSTVTSFQPRVNGIAVVLRGEDPTTAVMLNESGGLTSVASIQTARWSHPDQFTPPERRALTHEAVEVIFTVIFIDPLPCTLFDESGEIPQHVLGGALQVQFVSWSNASQSIPAL